MEQKIKIDSIQTSNGPDLLKEKIVTSVTIKRLKCDFVLEDDIQEGDDVQDSDIDSQSDGSDDCVFDDDIQHEEIVLVDGQNPRYNEFPLKIIDGKVWIPLFGKHKKVVGTAKTVVEKLHIVSKYTYYRSRHHSTPDKFYAVSNTKELLHNQIMGGKAPPGTFWDHINGDSLDDCPVNLRPADASQNAQNRAKQPGCTSIYKGLTKMKSGNFVSKIQFKNESYPLGTYKNEVFAAKVYDAYAYFFFKDTANTNGLLTPEEIAFILSTKSVPDKYLYKPRQKKDPTLPCWIQRSKWGTYNVCGVKFKMTNKSAAKSFKTLEEALAHRELVLADHAEFDRIQEEKWMDTPIVRDENDFAMIVTEYKPKNKSEKHETIYTFMDDEMYYLFAREKWSKSGSYVANRTMGGPMYRVIWEYYNGPIPKGMSVDHINGNHNDNRLCNLRLATSRVQNHNKRQIQGSTLLYKGYTSIDGRFRVDRGKDYKTKGYINRYIMFETEEEAAAEFNRINTDDYKDEVRLNIIDTSKKTTVANKRPIGGYTKDYINGLERCYELKDVIRNEKLNDRNRNGDVIFLESVKGTTESIANIKARIIAALGL